MNFDKETCDEMKIREANKKDLDDLLIDKLPDSLNEEQKKRKIRYLVNEILNKKEQKIKNIGTTRYSVWILK